MALDKTQFYPDTTPNFIGMGSCRYVSTTDNKATIKAAGYFDSLSDIGSYGYPGKLFVGDIINVGASDGYQLLRYMGTGVACTTFTEA